MRDLTKWSRLAPQALGRSACVRFDSRNHALDHVRCEPIALGALLDRWQLLTQLLRQGPRSLHDERRLEP